MMEVFCRDYDMPKTDVDRMEICWYIQNLWRTSIVMPWVRLCLTVIATWPYSLKSWPDNSASLNLTQNGCDVTNSVRSIYSSLYPAEGVLLTARLILISQINLRIQPWTRPSDIRNGCCNGFKPTNWIFLSIQIRTCIHMTTNFGIWTASDLAFLFCSSNPALKSLMIPM